MNKERIEKFDKRMRLGNKILFFGLGLIASGFIVWSINLWNPIIQFLSGLFLTMIGTTILVFNVFEDYIKCKNNPTH